MGKAGRKFTDEFKDQAVQLARDLGSNCEAGRQLGVNESVIREWRKIREPQPEVQSTGPLSKEAELERLRKENFELKKVNQILKAAAAVFCQDQLK